MFQSEALFLTQNFHTDGRVKDVLVSPAVQSGVHNGSCRVTPKGSYRLFALAMFYRAAILDLELTLIQHLISDEEGFSRNHLTTLLVKIAQAVF